MRFKFARVNPRIIRIVVLSLFLGFFSSAVIAPTAHASGKGSLYFPGNAAVQHNFYTLARPGRGQFTYEGWFKIDPTWTGEFFLFTTRESEFDSRGFTLRVAKKANGKGAFFSKGSKEFLAASATGYLEVNTWYHFAVTRQADGYFRYYANGVLYGTSTSDTISLDLTMGHMMFGLWFKGWMSNFRTTIGSALYTASGTMPQQNDAQLSRGANQTLFLSDYENMKAVSASPAQIDLVNATVDPWGNTSITQISTTSNINPFPKITPTLSWSGVNKTLGDGSFDLTSPTSTPSASGTYSFSSSNAAVASLSGVTATLGQVGTSLIIAVFTPSDLDSYESATASMTLIVAKASPVITWGSINKAFGDSDFTLTPTASVPGVFTFSSDTSTVISVSGMDSATAKIVGAGVSTLRTTFTPTDLASYLITTAATSVTVAKASQETLSVTSSPISRSGGAPFSSELTSLSTSGGSGNGAVTYSVSDVSAGITCNLSLSGGAYTLSAGNSGKCLITASKASDDNFLAKTATTVFTFTPSITVSYSAGIGGSVKSGSTAPDTASHLIGAVVSANSADYLVRTGYTFSKWNDGVRDFLPGETFTVGVNDMTLTAQWLIDSHTITFNANGGISGSTVSVNYNENAIASAPAVTKNQYTFAGWAETVTTSSIAAWTVAGPKTLYSLWAPKIYTINYDGESGTALTTVETFTVGNSPIQLQSATRAGYKFNGWFTDKTGGSLIGISGANFTPTDTATVHAQWTQSSLVGLSSSPTSFGTINVMDGNGGSTGATGSGTKAEVEYFADTLPNGTVITAYLQGNTAYAASQLTGVSNLLLSVVVAWKAPDETVPLVDPTKSAILLKITNPSIKRGAKVYSIVGDSSTVLTTASQDGYVAIELREDPEIVIANPVEVPAPPAPAPPSITAAPIVDNSAAENAAKLKLEEEAKKAAELKVAQEQAAKDLQAAREKAEAEIKAAQDAADLDAKLKAEADAKLAAELKAKEDSDIAAKLAAQKIVPDVTLYSISPTLKLSLYDASYLKSYVATLKPKTTVTCIGYIYTKGSTLSKAKSNASKQATAVCKLIKEQRKSLTTKVVIYPSIKAPKAAAGAKWVAVSYRVDGFKN